MDTRRWLDDHWLAVYLAVTAVIFALSVLLWKPGTRPWAAGAFVLGLILLGSFVTVLITGWLVPVEVASDGPGIGRSR